MDFIRTSVEDYRAASGPVNLTCQVEGATGTVTYQWTSTCTHDQCFVTGTNREVSRTFVRAGVDAGNHTCTATDSVGSTGTDNIVMNIVGMSDCIIHTSGVNQFNFPLFSFPQVLGYM